MNAPEENNKESVLLIENRDPPIFPLSLVSAILLCCSVPFRTLRKGNAYCRKVARRKQRHIVPEVAFHFAGKGTWLRHCTVCLSQQPAVLYELIASWWPRSSVRDFLEVNTFATVISWQSAVYPQSFLL